MQGLAEFASRLKCTGTPDYISYKLTPHSVPSSTMFAFVDFKQVSKQYIQRRIEKNTVYNWF